MSAQIRSELLKLRSTRTAAYMLLTTVAVVALGVVAQGLSPKIAELHGETRQRELLASSTGAVLLATYLGLLAFTSEFRYGTIRPTLLVEPRRRVVLGAKLVAVALAGVVFGVAGVVVSFGAGLPILAARDIDFVVSGERVALIAGGTIVVSALSAVLGMTVGAIVRNQVGAIVALGAWSLAVESVLFAAVPSLGRWLPGQAGNALSGLTDSDLLAPGIAAIALVVWTVAFTALADARTERSDIP